MATPIPAAVMLTIESDPSLLDTISVLQGYGKPMGFLWVFLWVWV